MGPCNTKDKKQEEQESNNNNKTSGQKAPAPTPKPKPSKAQQKLDKPAAENQKKASSSNNNNLAPPAKKQEEPQKSEIDEPNQKIDLIKAKKQETKKQAQVDFTGADMVSEKYGKIADDYTLLDPPLGTGAFGEVRKAIHKGTQMTRAVKIINKDQTTADELEKLINEVEIMKKLDHPHIVKVNEYYQTDKCFYIVSEICSGGELFDRIQDEGCYDEKKSCETITTILQAINYCHKNGIVHRDLKPENVLYDIKGDEGILKIIDFGTSLSFNGEGGDEKLTQVLGTPYYIAPEVLKKNYTEKCDVWSLGVILYILLCGYPPFYGKNDKSIMKKVLKGKYAFEGYEWDIISEDAKDLIKQMLVVDPANRLSASDCLQHQWIKNSGMKPVDENHMKTILTNMKGFKAKQKFQEAIYMFFVTFMATRDEKNELLGTFKELDVDNDGQLTAKELMAGYIRFMPQEEAEKTVKDVFAAIDSNHSGVIDYTEFVMACLNRQNMLSPERMEKVFQAFDQDGSGNLDVAEFKEIFGGNKIDDDVWKAIIAEADADNSGEISYSEFKNAMLKLID